MRGPDNKSRCARKKDGSLNVTSSGSKKEDDVSNCRLLNSPAILVPSTRHNVQDKASLDTHTQPKTVPRLARVTCTSTPKFHEKSVQTIKRSANTHKQALQIHEKSTSATRLKQRMTTSSSLKIYGSEKEASITMRQEINELKNQIEKMKLQMTEVVAQSTMSVYDLQRAATKKIADALSEECLQSYLHPRCRGQCGVFHRELLLTQMQGDLKDCKLKVELQYEHANSLHMETLIKWDVLECVWEGAAKSLVMKQEVEICNCLEGAEDFTSDLLDRNEETPRLYSPMSFLNDDTTPLKAWNLFDTPRYTYLKPHSCAMTSPQRTLQNQREVLLKENLVKAESEVKVLGDKVEKLRIVLEKVVSLLDYISKSSVSTDGTRFILRRIIEQLQDCERDV